MKTRKRVVGVATLVLALVFTLAPAPAAHAADFARDGQNPANTVCANDARTVMSARLYNSSWGYSPSAVIELRYSPYCRTVWARVTGASRYSAGDHAGGYARVTRNYDGKSYACRVYSGNSCYTAMVYDANMTSYAYGSDDPGFAVFTARTGNF